METGSYIEGVSPIHNLKWEMPAEGWYRGGVSPSNSTKEGIWINSIGDRTPRIYSRSICLSFLILVGRPSFTDKAQEKWKVFRWKTLKKSKTLKKKMEEKKKKNEKEKKIEKKEEKAALPQCSSV